jgi:hypothetical protein
MPLKDLTNTTEKRKELDPYILGMIAMGFKMEVSPREISKLGGVNDNTVKSIKARYLKTGSALNGTRSGRPKKLSARGSVFKMSGKRYVLIYFKNLHTVFHPAVKRLLKLKAEQLNIKSF